MEQAIIIMRELLRQIIERLSSSRRVLICIFMCLTISIFTVIPTVGLAGHIDSIDQTSTLKELRSEKRLGLDQVRYVWFEVNTLSYLNRYCENVSSWLDIGKPMVTARAHNVEAFTRELVRRNIPVVSGFKTSDLLDGKSFHNIAAWSEIARIARNVSTLTNGNPVVLENEGAVTKMVARGVTSINYEALLKTISMQQWPEIWFWYAPAGRREPVQTMSNDIARAIMNGIPHARLIEASSAGFVNSHADSTSRNNLKRTFTVDRNPISIIYLDDVKKNFWKLRSTGQAVKAAAGNTVIIYPGFGDIEKSDTVKESLGIKTGSQKNEK